MSRQPPNQGQQYDFEEEIDFHSPQIKKPFWRPSNLLFGCGIFLILVFSIAILAIVAQSKSEIDNIDSSPISTSTPSSLMEYIISNAEKEGCVNKFTATALSTCEMECEREFCSGKFKTDDVCRGECFPLEDASIEKCKTACVCCEAKMNCLLENSNDKEKCDSELTECKDFTPPDEFPSHQVADVCYSMFGMCRRTNFGFNDLIQCG